MLKVFCSFRGKFDPILIDKAILTFLHKNDIFLDFSKNRKISDFFDILGYFSKYFAV